MKAIKIFFRERRFTAALIIILIALMVFDAFVPTIRSNRLAKRRPSGIPVQDYEEYAESLKDEPSDIEGMSKYDKYLAGLSINDGSDSDSDGLTDKEEIEVYGSDPLKHSTSGDLYSDYYKVQNGMDVHTAYDDPETVTFQYNQCPEVELSASQSTDIYASVTDCTDRYSLDAFGIGTVYKGYYLRNYSGNLSIDLSATMAESGITESDIAVYVYQGEFIVNGFSDMKKVKFTTDGSTISVDYDFDPEYSYFVYITEKPTITGSIRHFLTGSSKQTTQATGSDDRDYLILAVNVMLHETIYYPEEETDTAAEKSASLSKAQAIIGQTSDFDKARTEYVGITTKELKEKYYFYKKILPQKEVKQWTSFFHDMFFYSIFCYQILGENRKYAYLEDNSTAQGTTGIISQASEKGKYTFNNYHTAFDPYKDTLPFQNFSDENSPGGNCGGITYLTSYLFNKGCFPSSGSYTAPPFAVATLMDTSDGETVSEKSFAWDLSGDPENATLMDPGLSDYKDKYFIDDRCDNHDGYIKSTLTEGEYQFEEMINAYSYLLNDPSVIPNIDYYRINNTTTIPKWSTIKAVMDELDSGRVVNCGMLIADGGAHAVLIYDYYQIAVDEYVFRVYDSNYPMSYTDPDEFTNTGAAYLSVKNVIYDNGTDGFEYLYYPVSDDKTYLATTDPGLMKESAIHFYDEDMNVIGE